MDTWHREIVRPLRTIRKRLKTGPLPGPNMITAHLRRWLQQVEIEADLIELDELNELIDGWELSPASGNDAQAAEAAIETVIESCSQITIDDRDRQAIKTIATAAG